MVAVSARKGRNRMGFQEIKGQKRAVDLLKAGFARGRISHAYLFQGPQGVGKARTALVFTQLLNCENPVEGEPCGNCSHCRRIREGNHPDTIRVQAEGKTIKISQIRTLQEKAYFKCYEAKYKVIMIEDAHLMGQEAANSLLKILEEPPEDTIFILITEEVKNLPSTILSRCQMVNFMPLDGESIKELLTEMGLDPSFALGLSRGSVGRARDFIERLDGRQLLVNMVQLFSEIKKCGYSPLLAWAEQLEKERDVLDGALDLLQALFRDRLVWLSTGRQDLLLGSANGLEVIDKPETCVQALEEISRSLAYLNQNANTRLVLEVLFLKLRNIICKERGLNPVD